jgi:hypothetical protein
MTELVLNYAVNPIWSTLKAFAKGVMESQERMGRARAAHYLASMGYYEEAKKVMLED